MKLQGRIQGFPKGGVGTRDTKCGGGGGGGGAVRFRPDTKSGGVGGLLPASGPIQKAGGGGAVRFRPDPKSGGGGGGGVLSV